MEFFNDDFMEFHTIIGYFVGILLVLRIIWGFIGSKYARFSQFYASPSNIIAYLRDILQHREARYIGHNPAGFAMVMALILVVGYISITGVFMSFDEYWGNEFLEVSHGIATEILLILIIGHISGVILASVRHKENLVKAMINGFKKLK